ncbi:hypothetical protein [Rubrivirga marina]|uniref:VCBS repeat-containing protein n=1 Tax=Rubrivirga marina TaxID=1196024 RepID=A0A271IXU1_9BACT|nr:hypothetical protein [Rubrivirga marina]PAP75525.1 hypothetical protein BSZ37_03245 [Rubrivirga marina]
MWILSLALILACAADTTDDRRADLLDAVARYADPLSLAWDSTSTRVAWTDLNGDGRDDALVYLTGADWCGSSGCTVLVFEQLDGIDADEFGRFRAAAEISLVSGPVTVVEGRGYWRDLVVDSDAGPRRLQFDGETYPMSPAGGLRVDGPVKGTTLFADGR